MKSAPSPRQKTGVETSKSAKPIARRSARARRRAERPRQAVDDLLPHRRPAVVRGPEPEDVAVTALGARRAVAPVAGEEPLQEDPVLGVPRPLALPEADAERRLVEAEVLLDLLDELGRRLLPGELGRRVARRERVED